MRLITSLTFFLVLMAIALTTEVQNLALSTDSLKK